MIAEGLSYIGLSIKINTKCPVILQICCNICNNSACCRPPCLFMDRQRTICVIECQTFNRIFYLYRKICFILKMGLLIIIRQILLYQNLYLIVSSWFFQEVVLLYSSWLKKDLIKGGWFLLLNVLNFFCKVYFWYLYI